MSRSGPRRRRDGDAIIDGPSPNRAPSTTLVRSGARSGSGCDAESPANDVPGQVERCGVLTQHEARVGREDDAAQLEREPVRVLVGGELASVQCGNDELADQRREPTLERGDPLLDRSGTGAHLEDGTGEEAAPWERTPH